MRHCTIRNVTPQFFDSSIFGSHVITYPEIDFASAHPILGYNRATQRDGAGATFAYMSDPAPHWGVNSVQWDQYQKFWVGALEHLLALP